MQLDIMLKLYQNFNQRRMLKLHNVLYPNICGADIIFDLIWVERIQGYVTLCQHYEWINTLHSVEEVSNKYSDTSANEWIC